MLLILFEIFVHKSKVAAIVDLHIKWLKQREFVDIISINKKLSYIIMEPNFFLQRHHHGLRTHDV